ncbi:hypothetical protein GCM10011507_16530 [Edaphobacter acidisoli]|uniref:Ice-binding protein C-terminal domain-containing protein n=1 Tax=Edaphobacter acidisoli TaxID=2040573 RepID=A0A916RSS8_9BACT|nr:PEP-CTERM sorting domain-containing protein [Edaphobacter acidisoli]GGA65637.1 hypothetical protein GCM10011507_16530 [Edaphobacter acidisoli]
MNKLLVALVLCSFAALAKADSIVIPFSGSGSSGTIAPGEPWVANGGGTTSWGSPGLNQGVLAWSGSVSNITDLSITFTGLPQGVVIDDLGTICGGGAYGGTVLCTGTTGAYLPYLWTSTISNGGDTITFDALPGVTLGPGQSYFLNILFSGSEGDTVNFTGGWSSPSTVPEPGTVWLMSAGCAALGDLVRRRRSR